MTGFSYVDLATQAAFGIARANCSDEGRRALKAQGSVENGIPNEVLEKIESWFQVMDFTGNININVFFIETSSPTKYFRGCSFVIDSHGSVYFWRA